VGYLQHACRTFAGYNRYVYAGLTLQFAPSAVASTGALLSVSYSCQVYHQECWLLLLLLQKHALVGGMQHAMLWQLHCCWQLQHAASQPFEQSASCAQKTVFGSTVMLLSHNQKHLWW
jgi:hypothetical protein